MEKVRDDKGLEFEIIVTGMHLSPEFGLTYKDIEKDGFEIKNKIEMLLSSDTSEAISKSTGLGVIGFAEAYKRINPQVIVLETVLKFTQQLSLHYLLKFHWHTFTEEKLQRVLLMKRFVTQLQNYLGGILLQQKNTSQE